MSKVTITDNAGLILLELYSPNWMRAEFIKQRLDGQFSDQFDLEILLTDEKKLESLINKENLTITLEAENGIRSLNNAKINQYTNKLTRDHLKLTERITAGGVLSWNTSTNE